MTKKKTTTTSKAYEQLLQIGRTHYDPDSAPSAAQCLASAISEVNDGLDAVQFAACYYEESNHHNFAHIFWALSRKDYVVKDGAITIKLMNQPDHIVVEG